MKTGFKDRLAIPKGAEKENKGIWDWTMPPYDERSSCFINAGQKYGVGKTQPIGKFKASPVSPIPSGKVSTLVSDEIA